MRESVLKRGVFLGREHIQIWYICIYYLHSRCYFFLFRPRKLRLFSSLGTWLAAKKIKDKLTVGVVK